MVLVAWLTEAAEEEQTSILHIILKVHIVPLVLDLPECHFFYPRILLF